MTHDVLCLPPPAFVCACVAMLALLPACTAVRPQSAPPFRLALSVREDQGVDRISEPVASGIPLPAGTGFDPAHIRLLDAAGSPVPCQTHQLGLCWPDGSLRWVMLQYQATVGAGTSSTYTLRVDPASPAAAPPQPVVVDEDADAVTVTTGPLRFVVSRTDGRLPNLLLGRDERGGAGGSATYVPIADQARFELVADREHMTAEEFAASGRPATDLAAYGIADSGTVPWGKLQRGIDYSPFLAGPVRITIEERGPLRAVLRVERDAEKREGEVGFVARLYAYAGKAYLRLEFTLESYEPFVPVAATPNYQAICNAKHIRKLAYCLRLPGKATAIQLGGVPETVPVQAAGSLALQQLEPRAFTVQSPGGEVIAKGEQAPGWIAAVRDGCSVALATKWFWEIAPKALGYDARSAELVLQLRPDAAPGPGYPLAAGRVKTYEFMLGLDVPGPQLSAGTRAELRAYPDPDYVAATGATHRFVSLTDPRFTTFADYVRRTVEKAAAVRLYGDLDFGDQIGWNADQRWNGYHGTTHEWFTFYLASGDPALFRIAEQETWHSIDVDTQHWGYAPGCREAEYARKQDHVCAAPIQGGIKVWNFGEIDCYFLTGRRRVLESLARNARFLLACGGVANRNYTPERATSLPFLHLSYLYEALGDEAALAQAFPAAMAPGAGRFRNDAIGTEPSAAWLATLADINAHFNRVYDRGEHMWCSFLASYPAEAFHRYYILTGDKTAANGVIKAARFLYHDMTMPTGIPKYAGGKPWSDDSPWIPWWDGVEAPAALAYLVSGDRTCLDWGAAPADWLLNYRGYGYSSGPWSWQGALGFGGTLSTYLWALREAGLTEAHVTRLRADLDYGNALAVCRSQCLAQRAPALQNTPESNVFCRLAAEVGRVLVNQGRYDEAIEWLSQWDTAPYGVYVSWVLTRAKTLKAGAPAERQ